MNDDKIISIIQRDLENKLRYNNIVIYSYPNIECCFVRYKLVDSDTGSNITFDILREELTALDKIHKAIKIYNTIIKKAQLLINERYDIGGQNNE